MKILHVDTEKSWRGGQQQALYLHQGLIKRDIESCFICPEDSAIYRRILELKLPVYPLKFRGEWDIINGYQLAKYARKHKFQLLHLHSGHSLSWGLWARLFYPQIKLVAVRRVIFSLRKNSFSILKYRNRFVGRIIAISENVKQVLLEDGIPEKLITTIHSGIDLEKFSHIVASNKLRTELKIPDDCSITGTVAAFTRDKDYPTLLRAASLVLKENPKVRFVLAGTGKLFAEMRLLANELEISDSVVFTGFRNNIGSLLKSLDIFVISSKQEGLGTSVLDAQSVELPIVGTKAGGIPEIIDDGVNGLLTPIGDPKALADNILRLIEDKSLQNYLGSNARESVKRFSIEHTVEKNIMLYRELLDG